MRDLVSEEAWALASAGVEILLKKISDASERDAMGNDTYNAVCKVVRTDGGVDHEQFVAFIIAVVGAWTQMQRETTGVAHKVRDLAGAN